MAFFDELSKKISQTGQSAVQKTKEMADIARVNAAISDEERRINNNHIQIGKLYVTLHKTDYEENFAEMMVAISDSENKIRDYRQQIRDIKGIVCCEKCGAEIANNTAFCSSCGASIPKHENMMHDADLVKCLGCGQMISQGLKFCTSCGRLITEDRKELSDGQDAEISEDFNLRKKCPNCGAELEADVRFCTKCGTQL